MPDDLVVCTYSVPVMHCSILLPQREMFKSKAAFQDLLKEAFPKSKKKKDSGEKSQYEKLLQGFRPEDGYYTEDASSFLWIEKNEGYSTIHLQSEPKKYNWKSFAKLYQVLYNACAKTMKAESMPRIDLEVMHRFDFEDYSPGHEFTDFGTLFSCIPQTLKALKKLDLYLWDSEIHLKYVDPVEHAEVFLKGPHRVQLGQSEGVIDLTLKYHRSVGKFSDIKDIDEPKKILDELLDEIMTAKLKKAIEKKK